MTNFDTYGNLLLKKLPYGRMRKAEVAEYANRALTIVEKHNPTVLLIKPVFDLLVAKQPEIDVLAMRHGVDPLCHEIKEGKSILNLNISTLKLKVQLFGKYHNYDSSLALITSKIDSYLRCLYVCNEKEFMQRVQGFINAVASNKELSDALIKHQLMDSVDAIKLAHTTLQAVIGKRVKILSERPKTPTSSLIGLVTNAIDNLFKAIEVVHLINPELDYEPLVNELNKLSDMFKLTINLRSARSLRKANGEEVDEPEIVDDAIGSETTTEAEITPEDESNSEMQKVSSYPFNGYNPYHDVYALPDGEEERRDDVAIRDSTIVKAFDDFVEEDG